MLFLKDVHSPERADSKAHDFNLSFTLLNSHSPVLTFHLIVITDKNVSGDEAHFYKRKEGMSNYILFEENAYMSAELSIPYAAELDEQYALLKGFWSCNGSS